MKPLLLFYANCQADGVEWFIRKTPLADQLEIKTWHNWRVLMLEEPLARLMADAARAAIFIYQPCKGYICTDGVTVPTTDEIIARVLRPDCVKISFSYVYNTGPFPILKYAKGPDGFITGQCVRSEAKAFPKWLLESYDAGTLNFDCALRFAECLAEQSRREETTDIKMAPWILQNFQSQKLFLTQNHPTSALFVELAVRILWQLGVNWPHGERMPTPTSIHWTTENEANLPGALPVHPSVVRELGLKYDADPDDGTYRKLLEQMIQECAQ